MEVEAFCNGSGFQKALGELTRVGDDNWVSVSQFFSRRREHCKPGRALNVLTPYNLSVLGAFVVVFFLRTLLTTESPKVVQKI